LTDEPKGPIEASDNDLELLALAEATLIAAGFETEQAQESGATFTLASSSVSLVLVAAFYSVRSMLASEPLLSTVAARSLAQGDSGRDGYLVLLTSQAASVGDARPIYDAMYNLRYLRRIVRADVDPDLLGVTRALRPVLPIASAGGVRELELTPLPELERRLAASGLPVETVRRAMDRFAAEDDPNSLDELDLLNEVPDADG
jgi:hypothetical protein